MCELNLQVHELSEIGKWYTFCISKIIADRRNGTILELFLESAGLTIEAPKCELTNVKYLK